MALLSNARKLLIGLFASAAVAGPAYLAQDYFVSAPSSTFAMTGASVSAGNHLVFNITRTSGNGFVTLTFITRDGTAKAGVDYKLTVKTVTFSRTQRTATIPVPTFVNANSTTNLTFAGVLLNGNSSISVVNGTIVKGVVSAPPPPATQVCPDGSTILTTATCPTPPTPGYILADSLAGANPIADNFDVTTSYDTGFPIPPSGAPDNVGAFRFICELDKLAPDDPVVYPGQPGRSHEHNFYGNELINANSTFATLRGSGGSSCNHYGDGTTAANRSGYWIPAMDDGKGHYVQPDYISLYYKRRPASDPIVSNPANPQYMGQAVELPTAIRFIFGYNMANPAAGTTGSPYFNCDGPTAVPGHYDSITAIATANACPAGNRIGFIIQGPACWDGVNLDTPDHRSHVSYASYGGWGYLKCDAQHPYVMPELTLATWYTVTAGDDLSLWHFSSDEMHPELAHGKTGHADYFEAWSKPIKDMWEANCINLLLNCNSGDLGNGKKLKGAGVPTYLINGVITPSWTNPNRLVAK